VATVLYQVLVPYQYEVPLSLLFTKFAKSVLSIVYYNSSTGTVPGTRYFPGTINTIVVNYMYVPGTVLYLDSAPVLLDDLIQAAEVVNKPKV
jgi:hypothetical protein